MTSHFISGILTYVCSQS